MAVSLTKRANRDGSTTLMLTIWKDGVRSYERLAHLKLEKATNPIIREANKKKLDLAKKIATERATQIEGESYGIANDAARKTIVVKWMQDYVDKYRLKDKRNMQGVLNRFIDFLKEDGREGLTMKQLNEQDVIDFKSYLVANSIGEGARSYFQRFKKILKVANRKGLLVVNPSLHVTANGMPVADKKEALTEDEIIALINTPIQSKEVKRAFLFCTQTGLRWVDVKALQWGNIVIDEKHSYLHMKQSKTGHDVKVFLNDVAIKLLGNEGAKNELVFSLPSANGANKTVKAWVKRAGIDKAITWHQARHSFGTNLAYNDANEITIASLMGHTTTTHTRRYFKASEELKIKAIEALNNNKIIDGL